MLAQGTDGGAWEPKTPPENTLSTNWLEVLPAPASRAVRHLGGCGLLRRGDALFTLSIVGTLVALGVFSWYDTGFWAYFDLGPVLKVAVILSGY